jgi:vesicle transport protein SEC22
MGVCYLTLCEKAYPKKLAFAYLEELQKEFWGEFGNEVGTAARPYAFIKFGMSLYMGVPYVFESSHEQ